MALDRIEIDWSNNGYLHPQSNVTEDFREYSVNFGMDTQANPNELLNRAATGALSLDNPGQRYSAELSTEIGRTDLFSRRPCRITSVYDDGTERLMWEGFASPPAVDASSGTDRAMIRLEGRLLEPYAETYIINTDFDAPVSWHLNNMFDTIGAVYTFSRDSLCGPVAWPIVQETDERGAEYQRTVLGFLNAISDYSGAYGLEDRCGYFAMYDGIRLNELPSIITVDPDDILVLHGDTKIWDRYELVRNKMRAQDVDKEIKSSIAIYDVKEQRVPPFFPGESIASSTNIAWIFSYLVQRSVPVRYAEIVIPRQQEQRKDIELLEPGVAFNLRIDAADGISANSKYWCAGCTLAKSPNEPEELRVYAIDTQWLADVEGFIIGESRIGFDRLGDGS